jgi:uncharacterized protein YecT (DUF1311 family)
MNRQSFGLASLLLGCMALQPSTADVKQAWSPRQPAWPELVVNHEPGICASMLELSQEWFASERSTEWPPAFLNTVMDEVDFGDELPLKKGFAYQRDLDLDGDGVAERIVIKGKTFRDEVSHEGFVGAAATDMDPILQMDFATRAAPLPAGVARFPIEEKLVGWSSSRDKGLDWSTPAYPIYRWRDHYYVAGSLRESAESGLALYPLKADGSAPVVCLVRSRAAREVTQSLTRVPEIRALTIAVTNVGSAGRSYCGTLNAGAIHDALARDATMRLATRPWAVSRSQEFIWADADYMQYTPRMWKFLEYWAAQDPWNKREYQTFLQTVEPARRAYAQYLVREFGLSETAARSKGDEALNQWIAAWFLIPRSFASDEWPETMEAAESSDSRLTIDPGHVNRFGKTNLMMAAHLNRVDLVRELLRRGADPHVVTRQIQTCGYDVDRGGRGALAYAAENASPLVMKLLLDAGADPKAKDVQGNPMSFYLQRNPRLSREQRQQAMTELAASAGSLADAPGFSCANATRRAERAICASEVLRLLDAEMSQAYAGALATPAVGLPAEQRRWTTWREKSCARETGAAYVECLADATAARERYLQYLTVGEVPEP